MMRPTLSPQEFVEKWRCAALKEWSAAQEHFVDVCHLVGQQTPAEAVLDAYGWPHDVGDEEILARLLALNLARSGS